jgi:CheY-like chemotaxis protein
MRTPTGPADILLIDDDPDIRHSLTFLLEEKGYAVATAAHGTQALEYLRRYRQPRLILLGLSPAAGEGWRFLAARHRAPTLSHVPVVALSTAGWGVRSLALALGADDFLDVPADPEDLLAVVGRYCHFPAWQREPLVGVG